MYSHYQRVRRLWDMEEGTIQDPLSGHNITVHGHDVDVPISDSNPPTIMHMEAIRLSLSITATANYNNVFEGGMKADSDYYIINFKIPRNEIY